MRIIPLNKKESTPRTSISDLRAIARPSLEETIECSKATSASCPVCKSGAPVLWEQISRYTYLRCSCCGVVYLERTMPNSELETFYNTSFEVNRDSQARKVDRQGGPLLAMLGRLLPDKGNLLEIGCSYGHFLGLAQQDGWDVEGIEISRVAADWARQEVGIPVYAGALEDALPKLRLPYDAVVILHVLEHVPEPTRFVSQLRQLLRPGGVLLVRTPNSSSWIASFCGSAWEWLSPPAHICLFTPPSLRFLLEHAGFQVDFLDTQRGDAHNTLFEITRSMAKQAFASAERANFPEKLPPSRTSWYGCIEAVSDFLYQPFERVESLFFKRKLRYPELVAAARRSG
jgi:SAM-dependent methyltransferase